MNPATQSHSEQRVALRMPDIRARTGLSRATIYRHVRAGTFPKPFKIGARAVAWDAGEVNKWLADCLSEREGGEG